MRVDADHHEVLQQRRIRATDVKARVDRLQLGAVKQPGRVREDPEPRGDDPDQCEQQTAPAAPAERAAITARLSGLSVLTRVILFERAVRRVVPLDRRCQACVSRDRSCSSSASVRPCAARNAAAPPWLLVDELEHPLDRARNGRMGLRIVAFELGPVGLRADADEP